MILTHHSFPFTSPSLTKYHKTVNLTIIDLIRIDKTSKHLATKINFYTLSRWKFIILRWKMSCYNFKIFENFSKKGGTVFGSRRLDIESSRDRFLHRWTPRGGKAEEASKERKKKKERHGRCSRGVERGVAERKWKPASLLDPLQRFYLPFRQCQPRGFIKQFLVAAAGEKSAWKIDSFRHGGCLANTLSSRTSIPSSRSSSRSFVLSLSWREGIARKCNKKCVDRFLSRPHGWIVLRNRACAPDERLDAPPLERKSRFRNCAKRWEGDSTVSVRSLRESNPFFCVFKKSLVNFYIRDCILVQILKNFSTFPRLKFNKKKIVPFQSCYPSPRALS